MKTKTPTILIAAVALSLTGCASVTSQLNTDGTVADPLFYSTDPVEHRQFCVSRITKGKLIDMAGAAVDAGVGVASVAAVGVGIAFAPVVAIPAGVAIIQKTEAVTEAVRDYPTVAAITTECKELLGIVE